MTTCYNPSKNVMFIHVHKCAGTAITKAFIDRTESKRSGWILPIEVDAKKTKDIMIQNNQILESQFSAPDHFRAIDMQEYLGAAKFKPYFKFAVSRNPWDRLASWYFFLRYRTNKGQSVLARNMTMEDFIKYSVDQFYLPQYQWVTNHKGKVIVDEIIKLENLSERWSSISDRISDEPIALKTVNASPNTTEPRPNPFANVRKETLELFRDAYAKDFELFDYDDSLPEGRDSNPLFHKLDEIWAAEVDGAGDVKALCQKKGVAEDVYELHREAKSAHYYINNVNRSSGDSKDLLKKNEELRAKFKDDFLALQAKIKNLSDRNKALSTEKAEAVKKNSELRGKFKDDFTGLQAKIRTLSDRNAEVSTLYKDLLAKTKK